MLELVDKKSVIRARIADEIGIILSSSNMTVVEFETHMRRINILRFRLAILQNESTYTTHYMSELYTCISRRS